MLETQFIMLRLLECYALYQSSMSRRAELAHHR